MDFNSFVDTRQRLDPKTASMILRMDDSWFERGVTAVHVYAGKYYIEERNSKYTLETPYILLDSYDISELEEHLYDFYCEMNTSFVTEDT